MLRIKKHSTSLLKQLLILLFISYYGNVTMFYHVHVINNRVYAHSHFFLPDPGKPLPVHNHSSKAFTLIHDLNQVLLEDTGIIPLFRPTQAVLVAVFIGNKHAACMPVVPEYHNDRAPPCSLV